MKPEKQKHQTGYIYKRGKSWFGRFWREELEAQPDGSKLVVRRQRAVKLCQYSDRYRSKRDVRPLLDDKLKPLNSGHCSATSTLSITNYINDYFLPYAQAKLKPSTAHGYRGIARMYLSPRLAKITLRDFRPVDGTRLLEALFCDHGLGRKSLRNCKALLSSVFAHSIAEGVLDGSNPVIGARIPVESAAAPESHAYTSEEFSVMLETLSGTARLAVALMGFLALRPGEARAARWEDFSGKTLRVTRSLWGTILTSPKTETSSGFVPVPPALAEILKPHRQESGYILAGPTGKSADLHNLASRVVRPALSRCATCGKPEHSADGHEYRPIVKWCGWYGLRRGAATFITSAVDVLAAKSLLRHKNIATTQQHYIKSVQAEAMAASAKMDAFYQKPTSTTVN
jgi:integrase